MNKVICPSCNKNVEKSEVCELCGSRLMLNELYYLLKNLAKNIGVKYLAEDKNNKKFIIKVLSVENLDNWSDKEHFQREINILKQLDYMQIPKYIDDFEENNSLYMVREYIDGITLEKELENKRYTEKEIIYLMSEITKIFDYMHNLIPPILYGNLKFSNIVRGVNGDVYLTDFLLSGDLDKISEISSYYDFLAPEQIRDKAVIESDFYFLGLIILKLITRKELESLKDVNGEFNIRENANISETGVKLLEKLIDKNPKKRIKSHKELISLYDDSKLDNNLETNDEISININETKLKFNNNIILLPIILLLIVGGSVFSYFKKNKLAKVSISNKISHTINKKQNDRFYDSAMSYYKHKQYLSAKINFETSCNQHKNAKACYKVASMYEIGVKGIPKKENKAKEYYKKACDLGEKNACAKIK